MSEARIGVVGATGVVGRQLVGALESQEISPDRITLFGSDRSEGEEVEYLGETLGVEKLEGDAFRAMQLVYLATPAEVSKQLAPKAQGAGAWVVDTSSAFRAEPKVPLVVAGVNDAVLKDVKGRIVATPSAGTAAILLAVRPLGQVESVHVTALFGASSAGNPGILELERQTANLLSGKELDAERFPHRLAFNVIPQVGEFSGELSAEEAAWRTESAKILGQAAFPITGTAMYVPTFYGVVLEVSVRARIGLPEARQAWAKAAHVKVLDAPAEKVYPLPMLVTADPAIHLGRIRAVPGGLNFVVALDNAGRGSALNAAEIGAALLGGAA